MLQDLILESVRSSPFLLGSEMTTLGWSAMAQTVKFDLCAGNVRFVLNNCAEIKGERTAAETTTACHLAARPR